MNRLLKISLSITLLLISVAAGATTLQVPSHYSTIAAALEIAAEGDTVLVACGTYYEHDLLMSEGITLRSTTGEPDCVTIDAEGLGRCLRVIGESNRLEGLTLINGVGGHFGGGIYASWHLSLSDVVILNCSTSFDGGAIYCHSGVSMNRVHCEGNVARHGGAIYTNGLIGRDIVLIGNRAAKGSALNYGGWPAENNGRIVGLTIALNTSTTQEGAIYTDGGGEWFDWPRISRAIIAFNEGGGFYYATAWPEHIFDDPNLSCSNVYGNEGGNYLGEMDDLTGSFGNLSVDPLFCYPEGGDFSLVSGSPCLPEGNYCGELMGAVSGLCDLTGLPEDEEDYSASSPVNLLESCFPNPFNPWTTITFSLATRASVKLEIFDISGRRVKTLIDDETLQVGRHETEWNSRNEQGDQVASGVYFCRLIAGDFTETKKMTLLK